MPSSWSFLMPTDRHPHTLIDRTHQKEDLAPSWPLLQGSPKEQVGTPAVGDASLVPAEEEVAAGCGSHLTLVGSQSRRRDEIFQGLREASEGPGNGTVGTLVFNQREGFSCSGLVSTALSIHSFICSLSHPTRQSLHSDHLGQALIRRAAYLLPRCGRA